MPNATRSLSDDSFDFCLPHSFIRATIGETDQRLQEFVQNWGAAVGALEVLFLFNVPGIHFKGPIAAVACQAEFHFVASLV